MPLATNRQFLGGTGQRITNVNPLFAIFILCAHAWTVSGQLLLSHSAVLPHTRAMLQAVNTTINATDINGTLIINGTLPNSTSFVYVSTSAPFDPGYMTTALVPSTPILSSNVTVESTPAPFIPGPFTPGQTVNDPVLGSVIVRASQTFPLPSRAYLASEWWAYRLSDPAFSQVGVDIPPGAWPVNETRPPTITVFDPPESIITALADDATKELAGQIVDFGPSGVAFLKTVAVTLPRDAAFTISDGSTFLVHLYQASAWLPRPTSRESETSNAVLGETDSFSPYAALAIPPPPPPPPTETPPTPPSFEERPGNRGACSAGCIAGAVFGTLFGVGICAAGGVFAYKKKYGAFMRQSEDTTLGPEDDAEAGRAGQEHEETPDQPAQQAWGATPLEPQADTSARDMLDATSEEGEEDAPAARGKRSKRKEVENKLVASMEAAEGEKGSRRRRGSDDEEGAFDLEIP